MRVVTDLPKSSASLWDERTSVHVPLGCWLELVRHLWPGADKTEFAERYEEKLRELVEVMATEERWDTFSREIELVLGRIARNMPGKRAEFWKPNHTPVLSDTPLDEKRPTTKAQSDGEGQETDHRQGGDGEGGPDYKVKDAFPP